MRKILVFLSLLGFAATLSAQSLVNLARVEKVRRQSLAGRHGPVVTNRDLFFVKLRPAVEVIVPEEAILEGEEEAAPATEETAEAGAPAGETTAAAAGTEAAAPAAPGTEAPSAEPTPEEKLKTTEEMIDLLQTKIAALNQDYSSQTNMTPNYVIEQQLTETLKKLQNAQAEATRLRLEIEQRRVERRAAGGAPVR